MTLASEIRAATGSMFIRSQSRSQPPSSSYLSSWKLVMDELARQVEELERQIVPPAARITPVTPLADNVRRFLRGDA